MKNLISWIEIPAGDFDRAVDFYNYILDLDLQKNDWGDEKMACFPGGEGAISLSPGFNPGRDGLLVSFNAGNDLDDVIRKISEKGGKILQAKTKIEAENRGYFSVFIDSEGNKVGLYGNK